jgi:hypothetical protein
MTDDWRRQWDSFTVYPPWIFITSFRLSPFPFQCFCSEEAWLEGVLEYTL